jgi:hypothetical protein
MARWGLVKQLRRYVAVPFAILLGLAFLVASPHARAELTAKGDLFVKFSGGIAPDTLPRHQLAPIAIGIAGAVKTFSGDRPPPLRSISIGIHRGGHLDTRGLPICHQSEINPGSTAKALEVCGAAQVGEGTFSARTAFPEQETFPAHGRIVAFNSVSNGHPTILVHIYGTKPVPITRVIVFHIQRHPHKTFDTTLSGSLPVGVNRYGYVKRIGLYLFRRFTYRGRLRSYLSAACAAPPGFPSAIFPFAEASMTFEDGRTLSSSLTRTCRVSG